MVLEIFNWKSIIIQIDEKNNSFAIVTQGEDIKIINRERGNKSP